MDKLDKQFEQLMKGITIDSPSKDFSMKVMERIQAEAAVQQKSLLEDYQPVISRKTWIIIITGFVALIIYAIFSGNETNQVEQPSIFASALADSVQKLNTTKISNVWEIANGLFTSIPSIAYLIILASLALWTLDLMLTRIRHAPTEIQIN